MASDLGVLERPRGSAADPGPGISRLVAGANLSDQARERSKQTN
jgi:hypothetical protein